MLTGSVFIICLVIAGVYAEHPNVTVVANAGTFIGYRQTVDFSGTAAELDKFLGIPYAEPPIGNLRFRKPVPKAPFSDPQVVRSHGAGCIQADVFMRGDPTSEDCLFLNVYAPVRSNTDENLAVMVWLYGGGFYSGSSNVYVADLLASIGEVIVVTINYRLFVLGFLNVQGADIDTNCGLWDQHVAIKWVNNNIGAFGGDANRVTVFGESAGAASAIYQGFFPGNKGLVQRIIAQSGTAAVSWAFTDKPESEAEYFASVVNCSESRAWKMVECLREIPTATYQEKFIEVAFRGFPFPFVPSLDHEFVSVSPYDVLDNSLDIGSNERDTFSSVDLLMGINTAEGGLLLLPSTGVSGNVNNFSPSKTEFDNVLVPLCVNITFWQNANDLLQGLVQSEYTPWEDSMNSLHIRDEVVNMYTDALFMAPMYRTLNFHTQISTKKTYMYRFTATPTSHVFPVPSWVDASGHGDDLLFIFGEVAQFSKFSHSGKMQQWENTLANGMMKLWANFAKTGNTNQPHDLGLDWMPYTKEQRRYLEIVRNLNDSVMKQRLNGKRVNLWNKIMPMSLKREEDAREICETSGARGFTRSYVRATTILMFVLLYLFVV